MTDVATRADLIHGYQAIADCLGISRTAARMRAATGEIPTFRMGDGKKVYARPSLLAAYKAASEAAERAWTGSVAATRREIVATLPRRTKGPSASLSRRRWVTNGKDRYAWSVRWKDEGGHYRGRQFSAKADAEAFLDRFRLGRTNPYEPLVEEITVGYIVNAYLKWCAEKRRDGRIARSSEHNIARVAALHIDRRIGHLRLSQVKLPQLTAWHSALKQERGLSAGVARGSARLLKSMFDYAMRREWVSRNPVTDLLVELRGIPAPKVRVPSVDEVRRLFAAVEHDGHFGSDRTHQLARCFAHIAAFCGLRFGEIAALDAEHLDLAGGMLKVRRSLSPDGEVKAPKTKAGNRDVPLPAHVNQLVATWVRKYGLANEMGLVFTARNGAPLNNSSFHVHCWQPALRAAQLDAGKSIHFHALRHFAASWMLKHGWAITDVSAMLGHARVNMTLDVYAHALTDIHARRPAMQALADMLVERPANGVGMPLSIAEPAPSLIAIGV